MRNQLLAISILGVFSLVTGCAAQGSAEGPRSAQEAVVAQTPMMELKGISDELNAGLAELTKPVDDAEAAIDELATLPKRHGLSAADVSAMAKGAVDGGKLEVVVSGEIASEIRAEIEASLRKLAGALTALKQTPDRVAALVSRAAQATARVPVLATKISATATATAANPFGALAAKKQAEADLAELQKVQADTMKTIQDIQAKIGGLPMLASRTLAKASKSLLG